MKYHELLRLQNDPPELFDDQNTHWEYEDGESYLVYDGDIKELAKEQGFSEDFVYDLFYEYEKRSRELVEEQREINNARKGEY